MKYSNPIVLDFAKRTRANLKTLRGLKKNNPEIQVYEVTQLINSMLGLLVFLDEDYSRSIPRTPLSDLEAQGWRIPKAKGDYQVRDLKEFIRYLRNAIAHAPTTLKFLNNEQEEIIGLYINPMVHHSKRDYPNQKWEVELSIEDIENITDKLFEIISP